MSAAEESRDIPCEEMDPSAEVCNSEEPCCNNEDRKPAMRFKFHSWSRMKYAAATDHADGTMTLSLVCSAEEGHDSIETGIKSADNHVS